MTSLFIKENLNLAILRNGSVNMGKEAVSSYFRFSQGLVGYRTPSNSFYFENVDLVVLYNNQSIDSYPSGVKYLRNRVFKTLKDNSNKFKDLVFAYSFSDDFSYELSEYGIEADKLPAVVIQSKGKKYKLEQFR